VNKTALNSEGAGFGHDKIVISIRLENEIIVLALYSNIVLSVLSVS